jgi:hypothetical protein
LLPQPRRLHLAAAAAMQRLQIQRSAVKIGMQCTTANLKQTALLLLLVAVVVEKRALVALA